MKRFGMTGLLLLSVIGLTVATRAGEDRKTVWDFYETHPHVQDCFAWGLYDIPMPPVAGGLDRETLQYGIDIMAENGFTASWGHAYSHRFVKPPASEDDILFIRPRYNSPMPKNPVLSELGEWAYGEMYPGREMKSLYNVQHWFRYNWPLFSESESDPPTGAFMTEEELAAVETRTRGVLDFITQLSKTYPDTIMGLVTDDEPDLTPGAKAAVDILERNTGMFATTIQPSWSGFKQWAPYMQPIGGDWYVTLNMYRKSWVIADRLRWLNENYPDKGFLFMPLLTRYGDHDTTLPGLKDALTSRIELRLQIWQAVALGCKSVYGWSTGGGVEWAGAGASPINALMRPTNGLWPELKDLGLTIVPIGPILLPCQADTSTPITVACGTVRYPEFNGPALDYGLLRDVRPEHDRYFLIPWNNDIDSAQTGTLTLPPQLVKGRKVYDLLALKEAALAAGSRLEIRLPPGSGHIYAVATPDEYAACRDTILRHRVRYPRVMATMRREKATAFSRLDADEADRLIAAAKQAVMERHWGDATARYREAAQALDKAEEKVRSLVQTKQVLAQLATVLTETDELLRTH
ncbi:MAG: hypothetical protein H8E44_01195, partial [Planctomycetes bacterium]|nr:hypothetical protein [Planctomycetota bacterium]